MFFFCVQCFQILYDHQWLKNKFTAIIEQKSILYKWNKTVSINQRMLIWNDIKIFTVYYPKNEILFQMDGWMRIIIVHTWLIRADCNWWCFMVWCKYSGRIRMFDKTIVKRIRFNHERKTTATTKTAETKCSNQIQRWFSSPSPSTSCDLLFLVLISLLNIFNIIAGQTIESVVHHNFVDAISRLWCMLCIYKCGKRI